MIRILIVEEAGLLRDALRTVLSSQSGLTVVADLARVEDIPKEVRRTRPDVVVVNSERIGSELVRLLDETSGASPGTALVVVTADRSPESLAAALRVGVRGFLGADIGPEDLIDVIRTVSVGERVVDAAIAVAALLPSDNPLSERERQVLRAVADGLPLPEIGRQLHLAYGTVRNHLSRILRKTGTRNRIEAVRRAHDEGWI